MSYELVFAKQAQKSISKLDLITKKRIGQKLLLFSSRPLNFAKKLTNFKLGEYRWRVGNYRITFDLDKKNKKINILRVDHRRDVYK